MRARAAWVPGVLALALSLAFGRGAASEPSHARPPATPSTSPSEKLVYFGGRVLANVVVYEVSWGPKVDPSLASQLPGFYAAVTDSPYFDWLAEYDTVGVRAQDGSMGTSQRIGRGSFGGAFTITPSYVSDVLSDDVIQAELAAQITAGNLPAPGPDALYMIDVPQGTTVNLYNGGAVATSCASYQGYHLAMLFEGQAVPYAVLPDCGATFTEATAVHAHELIESVTDPEIGLVDPDLAPGTSRPSAWYSFLGGVDSGEAADLCEGQDAVVAGYTVQQIWSNTAGGCIATSPTIICDGASPPIPGCRPCTAADEGAACNGARPHCETGETDAASVKVGQCVACTSSAECAAPNGTCVQAADDTDDTCVDDTPCASAADCAGTTPVCDASTHACRACVAADCGGATPACETVRPNVSFGRCVACTTDDASACTGETPVCDFYTSTCLGCVTDGDCQGGAPICALPSPHTCRACTSDADCTAGGTCITTAGDAVVGRCVACVGDAECPAPAVCGSDNECHLPPPDAGAGDATDATATDAPAPDAPPAPDAATNDASVAARRSPSSGGCSVVGRPADASSGATAFGVTMAMIAMMVAASRRRSRRREPVSFTAGSSATDRTASPDAQRKRDPGGAGADARRCWRMTPFAPCVLRGLKNTLRPAPPAHVCPARARADRAP